MFPHAFSQPYHNERDIPAPEAPKKLPRKFGDWGVPEGKKTQRRRDAEAQSGGRAGRNDLIVIENLSATILQGKLSPLPLRLCASASLRFLPLFVALQFLPDVSP